MRPKQHIIRTAALALTLAAGARADLIHGFFPSNVPARGWNLQVTHRHAWFPHSSNGYAGRACDLQALLDQYAARTQSPRLGKPRFGKPGIGPIDKDFPDAVDLEDDETTPPVPDPDSDEPDPDEDESETDIAGLYPHDRLPAPTPPAVPEPGGLAMMGAGVLGLLAARYCAKG